MIRKAVLCVSLCLLASCAKPSSPTMLPPSVCVDSQPEPRLPDGAGFVAPVTEAEKEAFRESLGWVAEVLDWGRLGWATVETAKKAC